MIKKTITYEMEVDLRSLSSKDYKDFTYTCINNLTYDGLSFSFRCMVLYFDSESKLQRAEQFIDAMIEARNDRNS